MNNIDPITGWARPTTNEAEEHRTWIAKRFFALVFAVILIAAWQSNKPAEGPPSNCYPPAYIDC